MKKPKNIYIYQAVIYGAASVFFIFARIFTQNPQRQLFSVILAVLFAGLTLINLVGNKKSKAKASAITETAEKNEKTEP